MTVLPRDDGGDLDGAVQRFGGTRSEWLDLSTGINPVPYPIGDLPNDCWTALPDRTAFDRLTDAARAFWQVPDGAEIIAAPGASALIARMPHLMGLTGDAYIPGPTYNEHAAAVRASDTLTLTDDPDAQMHVYVHPNNPDGRLWGADHLGARPLTVIDESFCDVVPDQSHINHAAEPGVVILKSFGKFWGLAGLRLGFAIAAPQTFAPKSTKATLRDHLGPWAVSGPALDIGASALSDPDWADTTRARLRKDTAKLDRLMTDSGAKVAGGTTLFRLYEVDNAAQWQTRLAQHHIWSRVFPYNPHWLRLGLPGPSDWPRVERALA